MRVPFRRSDDLRLITFSSPAMAGTEKARLRVALRPMKLEALAAYPYGP